MTEGPLIGTELVIPANALTQDVSVVINQGSNRRVLGFEDVGLATNFSPTGLELAVVGTATLTFDPTQVPAGTADSDVVVFRRTSQGRRVPLKPNSVDLVGGTATVDVDRFANYWVSIQTLDLDYLLATYLPLIDGDLYEYDNGVTLLVKDEFNEPNLQGIPVSTLSFTRDSKDLGLYLTRGFAETGFMGEFSLSENYQEVVFPPLEWLGETGLVGSTFIDQGVATVHVPYASPLASAAGIIETDVEIVSDGQLRTPAGLFPSVLELSITTTREDSSGQVVVTVDRMWLALGVGPVQIEMQGVLSGQGRLTAAIVGGEPVRPAD